MREPSVESGNGATGNQHRLWPNVALTAVLLLMVGCGTINEVKGEESLPDEDWLLVVGEATYTRGDWPPLIFDPGDHRVDLYYGEGQGQPVDSLCISTNEEIEVRFSLDGRRLLPDHPSYQQSAYIGGENNVTGEGGEGLVHNVSARLHHPPRYSSDQDGRLVSVLGPCPWEVAETGGRP